MQSLLALDQIWAGYGRGHILRGLSFEVQKGSTVAVIGPNGAGKTTLLRAITGGARVDRGTITYKGREIQRMLPHQIARLGISHVPQGRHLFGDLTVEENLRVGGHRVRERGRVLERIRSLEDSFPIIRDRATSRARDLSGGQQQMVAIARGLVSEPSLLLLDEPSLGLAPATIDVVADLIAKIQRQGQTVLLAEQNVPLALALADYVYVIGQGTVVAKGPPESIRSHAAVQRAYLGRVAGSVKEVAR